MTENNWKKLNLWYNIKDDLWKEWNKMSKKGKKVVNKHKGYDKGRIFVKVMAGILALLMVSGTVATLVFSLI